MGLPLILAHRGASAYAPENTIAAFRLARELGADGIELDVQLTRDRVPVVIHDDSVDRTTDGHGGVSALSVAEIAALDAGSWKTEDYRGEPVPTLAQVFQTLDDWLRPIGSERPGLINIELKTDRLMTDGLEERVINLIERAGNGNRILLSSFSVPALARAKNRNPRLPRGLLYDNSKGFVQRYAWLRLWVGARAMHPEHTLVTPEFMRWARSKRLDVNTWTVDEPEEARRLAELGVHAIITNKPDVIREALRGPDPGTS